MSSPVGTETKELRSAFLTIIIRAERGREKVNVREKERKNPNKQSRYAGGKKDGNAKTDKGSRKNRKVWHLEAFQLRAFRCFVLVAVT